MRLFFFGSLMDRDLLAVVVGREIDDLRFARAALPGFERRRIRGESFPIVVPHPGGRVEGVVVEELTAADLERIRFYESEDYAHHPIEVETSAGPADAQVFLPTDRLEDEGIAWVFETWLEEERPMCLALAEELMSHYGILTPEQCGHRWPAMKARARARLLRRSDRRRAVGAG